MKTLLFLHTVIHLKPKQIFYQIKYRLCNKETPNKYFNHSIKEKNYTPFIKKQQCYQNNIFTFLNIKDYFHKWDDIRYGMLWSYNLNYMDWLQQPNIKLKDGIFWINKFIEDFSENNIGKAPYTIALRGINWIKFIIENQKELSKEYLVKWNSSLYSQYILLTKKLEYHLLGNHLLEDAYSLFFAAIYFTDYSFYKTASNLLKKELKEQILNDGAHYEQSPMYHCILLERLLDCYNLSINNIQFNNQSEINNFLKKIIIKMLGHLDSICYVDKTYPLFNDSAINIAPSVTELYLYAKKMNIQWTPIQLKECGYRKFYSSNMDIEAIIDIGNITASYQPGHSHADTFNYELRIKNQPFIIDTGISTYNKTPRRQYERSTASHNTVTIEDKDSSEVWGGFRVGKRAQTYIIIDSINKVVAKHNGFGKNKIHKRSFDLNNNFFTIKDYISTDKEAISYIHLSPEIKILNCENNIITTDRAQIEIKFHENIIIKEDMVSSEYNVLKKNKVIEIHFNKNLQYTIKI